MSLRLLVVGASAGIGRAVAVAATRHGAVVVVAARRFDRLKEVKHELGGRVHLLECDIRDEVSCARVVSESVVHCGGLDAVVVAAGVIDLKALVDVGMQTWRDVLDTNVVGPAMVAAAAVPHLELSRGRIVFMSSVASRRPLPGSVPYSASKAALEVLAVGLQEEHPDIGVSCILLGPTDTEMISPHDRELVRERFRVWRSQGHLVDGVMSADDVAGQVLSLITSPHRIPLTTAMPAPRRRDS